MISLEQSKERRSGPRNTPTTAKKGTARNRNQGPSKTEVIAGLIECIFNPQRARQVIRPQPFLCSCRSQGV